MDRMPGPSRTRTPKIQTPFDLALALEFAQLTCTHARETLAFLLDAGTDEPIGPYIGPTALVSQALERVEAHLDALIAEAMAEAQASRQAQEGGAA